MQQKSHLCIPFPGIARPYFQFPHSCTYERFINSQDRSTYFQHQNRQLDHGNISIAHRQMNVGIGTVTWPRNSFSGNICFKLPYWFCAVQGWKHILPRHSLYIYKMKSSELVWLYVISCTRQLSSCSSFILSL
jgi:hypothetical protein